MKILVLPRSWNPYQRLLYREIENAGHRVRYVGDLTPSHTLNLLLLPAELIVHRLAGWQLLHIHWVYGFALTGSDRFPILRRTGQAWFSCVLAITQLIGLRVIWTAHNVLPHHRVFHDDVAARRRLVAASDIVVAHNRAALAGLKQIGVTPRRTAVIPWGPLNPGFDVGSFPPPGATLPPVKLLFFGQVLEYKGVTELLEAVAQLPDDAALTLTVAGECPDRALRDRLLDLARHSADRVTLLLERIPDAELTAALANADLVVLPFRQVTSSSTALLALGHGRGLVIPRLGAFDELPAGAVAFYDGSVAGLRDLLVCVAQWSPERLRTMGDAAAEYSRTLSWAVTAQETLAAIAAEDE